MNPIFNRAAPCACYRAPLIRAQTLTKAMPVRLFHSKIHPPTQHTSYKNHQNKKLSGADPNTAFIATCVVVGTYLYSSKQKSRRTQELQHELQQLSQKLGTCTTVIQQCAMVTQRLKLTLLSNPGGFQLYEKAKQRIQSDAEMHAAALRAMHRADINGEATEALVAIRRTLEQVEVVRKKTTALVLIQHPVQAIPMPSFLKIRELLVQVKADVPQEAWRQVAAEIERLVTLYNEVEIKITALQIEMDSLSKLF